MNPGSSSRSWPGRLVESSIGAFLSNASKGKSIEIYYWRFKDKEVDFVLEKGDRLVAIEVKSGPKMEKLPGIELFSSTFKNKKIKNLLVGKNGFPIEDFLQIGIEEIFN